jgi:large subunit ribosomal protein L20
VQVSYSHLIHGLQQQNINLNRKVLSELAINEPLSFKALVEQVRFMRGEPNAAQPQA